MLHLAATEHDGDLDLVTLAEKLLDLAGLRVEVAGSDLRAVLHLLDGDVRGLLAGLFGPLCRLVLVLPVVHDATHGRIRLVRDLDEVEVELLGDRECLGQRTDAQLLAVGSNEPHLTSANTLVVAGFVTRCRRSYCRSRLINAHVLPRRWMQTKRPTKTKKDGRRKSRRPPTPGAEAERATSLGAVLHRPGAHMARRLWWPGGDGSWWTGQADHRELPRFPLGCTQ